MITPLRLSRMLLAALAVSVALVAVAAPASADVPRVTVWLDEQSGVLSITGTDLNDYAAVSKQASATAPGGYVLVINVKNWECGELLGELHRGRPGAATGW